ncbi:MAG: hypothetical protein LE180_03235, partial [Endomicrobium sp.]|nr:hypothetical protein [Endomicrobium sp.]
MRICNLIKLLPCGVGDPDGYGLCHPPFSLPTPLYTYNYTCFFGCTRRKDKKASEDGTLRAIIKSGVKTACIFGKAWNLHVKRALKTTNEENLKMIYESIAFLKSKKLEVLFDAEHYFDGYKNNKRYALKAIKTAITAGATIVCLCETNGGMLPSDIQSIVKETRSAFPNVKFGIHAHNDSGCAVANSIAAIEEGCILAQGTVNG